MDGSTIEGLDAKRAILAETLVQTKLASFIGDMTVGAALANAGRGDAGLRNASVRVADLAMRILNGDERAELQARDQLREWLGIDLPAGAFSRQPIHWPLVFPEVFENDGFDAIIGNPLPWWIEDNWVNGDGISGASCSCGWVFQAGNG